MGCWVMNVMFLSLFSILVYNRGLTKVTKGVRLNVFLNSCNLALHLTIVNHEMRCSER